MIIKDTFTFVFPSNLSSRLYSDFINYKNDYVLISGSVGLNNPQFVQNFFIQSLYNSFFIGNPYIIGTVSARYVPSLDSVEEVLMSENRFDIFINKLRNRSNFLADYLNKSSFKLDGDKFSRKNILQDVYELININLLKTSKFFINNKSNYNNYSLTFDNLINSFLATNVIRSSYNSFTIGNGVYMIDGKLLCCLTVQKEYVQLPNLLFLNNLIDNITQEESIINLRDNYSQYFKFQIDEDIFNEIPRNIEIVKFLTKFMRTLNIKTELVKDLHQHHFLNEKSVEIKVTTEEYINSQIKKLPVEVNNLVNEHPF